METLECLVERWLSLDRDEATRSEIQSLVQADNTKELERRLRTRIAFGTAGLRGRMEAGFSRMNALTVIQASQGLAAFVANQGAVNGQRRGIVVGHDARRNSSKFAGLAAAVFASRGFDVYCFSTYVHTPLVPYVVGLKGASAGVVVTASHNPKDDNGYKVYWANASQIIYPVDKGIAQSIADNFEPWSDFNHDVSCLGKSIRIVSADDQQPYYESIANIVAPLLDDIEQTPRFVYTPLHGVGLPAVIKAGEAIQRLVGRKNILPRIHCVPEHAVPDAEFPTVKFPNPEEKGALDLATSYADELGVCLVFANDPDADRFAVAEKLPNGTWYQLTGNEIGTLLACMFLEKTKREDISNTVFLNTAVSSRMLKVMCEKNGAAHEETLTGFKWLGNRAQELQGQGHLVPYAYEEAIGYMFADVVYDKDGVAALYFFLAAAAEWLAKYGMTPYQKMQQLYHEYGFFIDANTYVISPDAPTTVKVFDQMRAMASEMRRPYPDRLGERAILTWRDLTNGFDSTTDDNIPLLPVDPASQMLTFELERQTRVTIRGSGTEPKIKLYVESQAPTRAEAESEAQGVLQDILNDWIRPSENGLTLP